MYVGGRAIAAAVVVFCDCWLIWYQTERLFAGWLEEVTITASTDVQVENLKRDCPCGVTWTKGTPQTLKSCPTGILYRAAQVLTIFRHMPQADVLELS